MRNVLTGFCCLAGILLFVPAADGAVFYVSDPAGFQTDLTTAAGNGQDDTINVAAGTYNIPATLTYRAAPGEVFSLAVAGAGAGTTFIDGGGAMQVLRLVGSGDVSISGLTIRNGSLNGQGGGVFCSYSSGLFTLSDSVVTGNHSDNAGGGVYIGGGADAAVTNTTFSNNSAGSLGGGLLFYNSGAQSLSNSTISGNTAAGGGGLFANQGRSTITITGSTFSGNTINTNDRAGGVYINHSGDGALTFADNTISDNIASGACGVPDLGVGMELNSEGPVIFARNLVENNTTACSSRGAGFLLNHHQSTDTVVVADNIFSGNTSGAGSTSGPVSLRTEGGTLNVVNNTFSGNDSGVAATADVSLEVTNDSASLNVSNNIFFGDAGEDELEIRSDGNGNLTTSPATFRNNIVDPFQVTFTPGVGVSEAGNFEADPLFADRLNGDFHLLEGSPAIDGGLFTAPGIQPLDFDGDARVMGDSVDIGADEFLPPNPATFFSATGMLKIPEVQLGGTNLTDNAGVKAYQVDLTRLGDSGYVFELGPVKKMTATANPSATFNPGTGVLNIPVVRIQGIAKTYNVQMQKRSGSFIFDLTKAKKN